MYVMRMRYVYILTNVETGRVYVGQTKDVAARLLDHAAKVNGNCGTGTTAVMAAECGGRSFQDVFHCEVVFGSADTVAVSQREVALIKQLRDAGEVLYNQHMGGSGSETGKLPVRCVTTGELFENVEAAARHFSLHHTAVYAAILRGTATNVGRKLGRIFACVETGETWPGLQAWCTAKGLAYQSMYHRLRNGGAWDGFTYVVRDRQPLFFEWG